MVCSCSAIRERSPARRLRYVSGGMPWNHLEKYRRSDETIDSGTYCKMKFQAILNVTQKMRIEERQVCFTVTMPDRIQV